MSEYKALSVRECAEAILKIERPLVLMHARPDGDTAGTCSALCKVFRMLGREPKYLCADRIPARLSFILEGESEADRAELSAYEPVAVDVASVAQLGSVYGIIPRPCLMIDHHELGAPFADNYIIPGASSGAEVLMTVCEELIAMGRIKLTRELAYALYVGICSDTGGFRYSCNTANTMRRAALLMETGIDWSDISHRLFSAKTAEQLAAEGFISKNMRTAAGGRVAYAGVSREERAALGAEFSDFETSVDIIRSLLGVEISFVVKETDEGEFRVSIRSVGADVALIAAHFGGGGHIRAAGCTVKAGSVGEAERLVLDKILQVYYK